MYSEYFQTFCVLAYRDLRLIASHIKGRLIDGCIIVFLQTLAIGQFLPLLGMPASMVAPLYIGTITQVIFSTSFAVHSDMFMTLKKYRFFRYQMSLPLPKTLLFAEYIFTFMLEIFSILIPVFCLGTLLLGRIISTRSDAHTTKHRHVYFNGLLLFTDIYLFCILVRLFLVFR